MVFLRGHGMQVHTNISTEDLEQTALPRSMTNILLKEVVLYDLIAG
jgi:hypothetical protein